VKVIASRAGRGSGNTYRSLLLVFLAAVTVRPVGAQVPQVDTLYYSERQPAWAGQLTVLAANTFLGALTGGIAQELRGGSFRDGFTRGALGGAVTYLGKRVAVERFNGAGLIGRQVGALGSSMVRNAGDGIPTLDRLVVPLGVGRLYVRRGTDRAFQIQPKLDALATAWVLYGAIEDDLAFDAGASLSAGTFVFKTSNKVMLYGGGEHSAGGFANAGVVYLSDVPAWGRRFLDGAFAHERVHIVQEDQLFVTLTDPFEDWVVQQLPGGHHVSRWLDLNVSTEIFRVTSRFFPSVRERPWEMEANYLSR